MESLEVKSGNGVGAAPGDDRRLEDELRQAISEEQLAVYYQPCLELKTGRITGMEALLRWHHPELGVLVPTRFIPVAEARGLLGPIGEWVLATACGQGRRWLDATSHPVRVSVNLSRSQLLDPRCVETVATVLHETELAPELLELEVSEQLLWPVDAQVQERCVSLVDQGVCLTVDDFGAGGAVLHALEVVPFQTLKVGRSVVGRLPQDPRAAALLAGAAKMARVLGARVVAVGVENEGQCAALRELGCDEAQGHLFSVPVPADLATARLAPASGT